jgi:peroxiredoxin
MRRNPTTWCVSLLGAAGLALGIAAHVTANDAVVKVGSPVPDFALKDEAGVEHKLSDLKGKLVVLEWTNQECPFVQRHYKKDTMEKLAAKFGGEGVVWMAVNSTSDNNPSDTPKWKKQQGFAYPTLQDQDGKLGKLFNAKTTPHMYVIDATGKLAYAGAIDDDARGSSDKPVNYVEGALQALERGEVPDPSQTTSYGCSVKYSASN